MSVTLISTVTVGAGGASSISFSSIPQTFTDLMVTLSARTNAAGTFDVTSILLNGTGVTGIRTWGTGSAANSQTTNYLLTSGSGTTTANMFSNGQIYIPNYTGSTNKSLSLDNVSEDNQTLGFQTFAGLLCTTGAVTTLQFSPTTGTTFLQNTTASLYGITKGSGGATVA